MESGFNSWFKAWDITNNGILTRERVAAGLSKVLPAPPAAKPGQANTFNSVGNSTPMTAPQLAVDAMMAALPTTRGVKPLRSRKVLVLAHTGAGGFVHASIPLAAKTRTIPNCLASEAAASGGAGPNLAAVVLSNQLLKAADKDHNDAVNRREWTALAADSLQKLDPGDTGKVSRPICGASIRRRRLRTSSRNRSCSGRSSTP